MFGHNGGTIRSRAFELRLHPGEASKNAALAKGPHDERSAALAPGPARMLVDIAVPRNFEDLGHSAPARMRAYNASAAAICSVEGAVRTDR